MNIINNKKILAILIFIIFFLFCIPGVLAQLSFAADDSEDGISRTEGEAFAVFDSSDGSLKLFRDEPGTYSDGQVVGSKTYYTGIETATGLSRPKWKDVTGSIKSFSIEEGDIIKPLTCSSWFSDCTELTDVDMTGLDTSVVTSMYRMFYKCSNLISLDISGFRSSTVPDQTYMFYNCSSLMFIRLPQGFSLNSSCNIRTPFQRIESVEGEVTSEPVYYNASEYNGDNPGLYRIGGKTMAVFDSDDCSLTFTEDDSSEHLSRREVIGTKTFYTSILNTGTSAPGWSEYKNVIKKVSFLKTVAPISCYRWFRDCKNMEICDLQKLDTSKTTRMSDMFTGCRGIFRISLGEKSIFTTDLPNSGWKRYKLPDGNGTDGPELSNLSDYDGTAPGWYNRKGSDICAVYDSYDGSLTFFKDESGEFYNGQIIGEKTYYVNFTASGNIPWEDKKSHIQTVVISNAIEPDTIKGWFSGCTEISELDLSNLKIPSVQKDALKGCVSLRRLIIGHNENETYIQGSSMLSGIWRNQTTGEECRLVIDGEYNSGVLSEGEWELVNDMTVTLHIDRTALDHLGINEDQEIRILHTKNGETAEGETICTFSSEVNNFIFNDEGCMYISDAGNIEYYEYCFDSLDRTLSITWEKALKDSESAICYDLYLRNCRYTLISGTIRWEGDEPQDRPEKVMVDLWRNGTRYEEQEVSKDSGWKYSFAVPATDEYGVICNYEVKEEPVDNYVIYREGYDGMRLIFEKTDETIPFFIFRRGGRWYEADVDFNGGVLTVPGDAVYLPVTACGVNVLSADKIKLTEEAKNISDSWLSIPFNTPTPIDDWLSISDMIENAKNGTIIPLTDSPLEMSVIIKEIIGNGDIPNLYTITDPYPLTISGECIQAGCSSLGPASITNKSLSGNKEIKGKKIWDEHQHPDEITVILKQNGEEISRKKTSESTDWVYSFNNLPIFDNEGKEYEYTVTEKPVKGYYMTKEKKPAEDLNKAVRIKYTVNRSATNINLEGAFFVTYDSEGKAYKYTPESGVDNGDHTVIFPTLDFDLVFSGNNMVVRGIRTATAGYPIIINDIEIVDSPYECLSGATFTDRNDPAKEWSLCDLSEESQSYPDRTRLYHYNEDEKAALAYAYGDRLNVIPYTIKMDNQWENLRNQYKEGRLIINKTDENGEPLENAEFELYFTENTAEDEEWERSEAFPTARGITDERGELILENIPYGCYLLVESKAPEGYMTREPGKVVINSEETLLELTNDKTRTKFRKVDEKGQLIGGAELKLFDSEGRELDSWITVIGTAHEVRGLTEGKEYILKEITSPEGYDKADDIVFKVQKGKDTEIIMEDKQSKDIIPVPTGVKITGLLLSVALVAGAVLILKRN